MRLVASGSCAIFAHVRGANRCEWSVRDPFSNQRSRFLGCAWRVPVRAGELGGAKLAGLSRGGRERGRGGDAHGTGDRLCFFFRSAERIILTSRES